jgi:hypothetical protein
MSAKAWDVPKPLLSTYRTGENRVTSSTMAVFERIDLALVQELLRAVTGMGSELQAVSFENQVTLAGSVPDAQISARFSWCFETKTEIDAYARAGHSRAQLLKHSTVLHDPGALLFVITPDPVRPAWFDKLDGLTDEAFRDRILWFSFRDLAEAIDKLITDPARVIGEQTRFLLAELVALYEADGLLSADDTVVVAARAAWPEYQRLAAYICQPNRSFRAGLKYLGFYAEGAIQPLIPHIRKHYTAVLFTRDEACALRASGEAELATLIEHLLDQRSRTDGEAYDVLLLTGADDPRTVHLQTPIANDTVTESGKPWGWTLSQRYTRLDKLTSGVTRTSQL